MKRIATNILLFFMIAIMSIQLVPMLAFAEESATSVFPVDSLNGTRWENYICVYKDIETTKQNQWGCNIVVDENGVVTEKIPGGDVKGQDLAVPAGGMVVSGIGAPGDALYQAINIGDNVVFDEYSMRVFASSGEINPFYECEIEFDDYNAVRSADTVIIYNESGKKTGTNSYGYEACVDSNGYVISCGGNDNLVPEGGYVVSGVGYENVSQFKLWFTVGAKCEISGKIIKISYSSSEFKKTVETELELVKNALEEAKNQYRIINYDGIRTELDKISVDSIKTIEQRNSAIAQIKAVKPMLLEQKRVHTRGVWYVPEETSAEDIKTQVELMAKMGINELALYVDSDNGSLVPIPESIPFAVDDLAKEFDLLKTYIDECHARNMTLVVMLPVMQNSLGKDHPEWFCVDSMDIPTDGFYSPANAEYKKAFADYVTYILKNYDVDGVQLDYIRYPEFGGSVDYGYDEASIKLFTESTGLSADVVEDIRANLVNHEKWNDWCNFKVELINGWVKDSYTLIKELRPDVLVSAAVAEGGSLQTYCQDYAAWCKGGYIDGIYPMTYVTGVNEATINSFSANLTDKNFLVMGCGTYLSYTNDHILDETINSIAFGADGIGYFEWTSVIDHGYDKLFREIFTSASLPLTADAGKLAEALLESAKERIALYSGNNAEAVKTLITSATSDKASLIKVAEEAGALLSAEDAKLLLADIKTAVRIYDMYGIEAENIEASKPEENGGSTGTIIAIAVCVIAVAICAVAVLRKKKKSQ